MKRSTVLLGCLLAAGVAMTASAPPAAGEGTIVIGLGGGYRVYVRAPDYGAYYPRYYHYGRYGHYGWRDSFRSRPYVPTARVYRSPYVPTGRVYRNPYVPLRYVYGSTYVGGWYGW